MKLHAHISHRFSVGPVIALIASLSFAGQAEAEFEGPGTYVIAVDGTPQVLDVEWNLSIPGQHVIRWGANNGANQKFNILDSNYGGYVIRSVNSGLCLDLPLGSTEVGTQPIQFPCGDQASQRFYIKKISPGLYRIRVASNRKRILHAPNPAGRVRLARNPATPVTGMRFRFTRI
jgi:hypothetical protein